MRRHGWSVVRGLWWSVCGSGFCFGVRRWCVGIGGRLCVGSGGGFS